MSDPADDLVNYKFSFDDGPSPLASASDSALAGLGLDGILDEESKSPPPISPPPSSYGGSRKNKAPESPRVPEPPPNVDITSDPRYGKTFNLDELDIDLESIAATGDDLALAEAAAAATIAAGGGGGRGRGGRGGRRGRSTIEEQTGEQTEKKPPSPPSTSTAALDALLADDDDILPSSSASSVPVPPVPPAPSDSFDLNAILGGDNPLTIGGGGDGDDDVGMRGKSNDPFLSDAAASLSAARSRHKSRSNSGKRRGSASRKKSSGVAALTSELDGLADNFKAAVADLPPSPRPPNDASDDDDDDEDDPNWISRPAGMKKNKKASNADIPSGVKVPTRFSAPQQVALSSSELDAIARMGGGRKGPAPDPYAAKLDAEITRIQKAAGMEPETSPAVDHGHREVLLGEDAPPEAHGKPQAPIPPLLLKGGTLVYDPATYTFTRRYDKCWGATLGVFALLWIVLGFTGGNSENIAVWAKGDLDNPQGSYPAFTTATGTLWGFALGGAAIGFLLIDLLRRGSGLVFLGALAFIPISNLVLAIHYFSVGGPGFMGPFHLILLGFSAATLVQNRSKLSSASSALLTSFRVLHQHTFVQMSMVFTIIAWLPFAWIGSHAGAAIVSNGVLDEETGQFVPDAANVGKLAFVTFAFAWVGATFLTVADGALTTFAGLWYYGRRNSEQYIFYDTSMAGTMERAATSSLGTHAQAALVASPALFLNSIRNSLDRFFGYRARGCTTFLRSVSGHVSPYAVAYSSLSGNSYCHSARSASSLLQRNEARNAAVEGVVRPVLFGIALQVGFWGMARTSGTIAGAEGTGSNEDLFLGLIGFVSAFVPISLALASLMSILDGLFISHTVDKDAIDHPRGVEDDIEAPLLLPNGSGVGDGDRLALLANESYSLMDDDE